MMQKPLRVVVSGAGGLIGYSLVPMLAMGQAFGPNQKISLSLLDVEQGQKGLNGLKAELEDCVYPLVTSVDTYTDPRKAFEGIDYAILAGAAPRKAGMERKDLLKMNAGIFKEQGLAMKEVANKTAKVVVVGNPANTNALLLQHFSELPKENITALTRLDENRARGMIARRLKLPVEEVKNITIWGNHSATQYPDVYHATAAGKPVRKSVSDDEYLNNQFIKDVQQRGAYVIQVRGGSSATSAARASIDHVRDWHQGTPDGEWVSMAINSDNNPYGVAPGLVYSFPVRIKNRKYEIVKGLEINDFSQKLLNATEKELKEEKEAALAK
jgi:malate dehydrogenase